MNKVTRQRDIGGGVLRLVQGDITLAETDAIVNPANTHLQLGGGVAGAIARRGGPQIQRECDAIGFCAEGEAVVTGGGDLTARYVVHAVGPRGGDPQGDQKLRSALVNSLARAQELGLGSISVPAISTGIFGFPKDRAAQILLGAAAEWLDSAAESTLRQVDFVVFDDETLQAFEQEWQRRWGSEP